MLIIAGTFYIAETRACSSLEDPSSNSYQPLNYNPRFCADAGLTCIRCAEWHDNLQFYLCIKGAKQQNVSANGDGLALMHTKWLFEMELVIGARTE